MALDQQLLVVTTARFPRTRVAPGTIVAGKQLIINQVTLLVGSMLTFWLLKYRLATGEQYLGEGGPEDKIKMESQYRPGDQDGINVQTMKRRGIAD